MIGVTILSLQDSVVKLAADHTSFWQFQLLRSLCNLMLLAMLARMVMGWQALKVLSWRWVAVRSLFLTLCMFCFFSAAPKITFAQMATGLYTYPMFVTLLSSTVLREPVGPWRFGALAVSAFGAVLILSPWSASFSAWQLLPVLAGFFYACNVMTLRRWCQTEHPMALAMVVAIFFCVSGLAGIVVLTAFPVGAEARAVMPFVVVPWPELTAVLIGFAVFASFCNLAGNIALSRAYQSAEPAWLAPFDYSYLAIAVMWGVLLFGEIPSETTMTGMALIGTAGIVTALREVRRQPKVQRRGPIR